MNKKNVKFDLVYKYYVEADRYLSKSGKIDSVNRI